MTKGKDLAPRDQVQGLVKGLLVMEAFDSAHTRMTLTEAARRVGITSAAARRCLLTLCDMGYAQTDGKLFWLGHSALRISYAYASSTRLPRLMQSALDGLSERSRDSASLAVLHDNAAVIAARSTARRTMRVSLGVGSKLPLYCSAAGRVLVAARPPDQWAAIIEAEAKPRLTEFTITGHGALLTLLATCRRDGVADCDQEIELGVRSIAVPLLDQGGHVVAAVSMSTRAERMSLAQMKEEYLPVLHRTQAWARSRIGSGGMS